MSCVFAPLSLPSPPPWRGRQPYRRPSDMSASYVLFSFGPRPRIPWKIISCVNGQLVLSAGSPSHSPLSFSFCFLSLPSTFALLSALRIGAVSRRRRNRFSLIISLSTRKGGDGREKRDNELVRLQNSPSSAMRGGGGSLRTERYEKMTREREEIGRRVRARTARGEKIARDPYRFTG